MIWSDYWNPHGSFTQGPQPCACGGPASCVKKDSHIQVWLVEEQKRIDAYNALRRLEWFGVRRK